MVANPQYLAAWTAQTIKYLEVLPSVIMMYDYVLTLEEEVSALLYCYPIPMAIHTSPFTKG
ncbi:hypothetical protein PISMIDRAFT_12297 [Pisolithus microcarpus 441]|uniref:Uncharacterized protein n=1 Tax=Pisolithus microcarpus 441 TaxID=765257 RepID=A0A0C9Z5B9_9AGAM|nr:hypothetical protein PISMIDRAFT_12297 [Pisolithus microcarpus 441]